MANWFRLTLDTTAPLVTWGAPTGTDAGETFSVQYALNETGTVRSATLTLRDGRVLDMAVAADRLTVALPEDTPQGQALVRAVTRDDLLNEAIREQAFLVTGTLPPAPEPTTTLPIPAREFGPVVRRSHARATARSRYRTRVAQASPSRVRVRSTVRVHTGPPPTRSRTRARAHASIRVGGGAVGQARASADWTVTRRDPPPDLVAALMLDLL